MHVFTIYETAEKKISRVRPTILIFYFLVLIKIIQILYMEICSSSKLAAWVYMQCYTSPIYKPH